VLRRFHELFVPPPRGGMDARMTKDGRELCVAKDDKGCDYYPKSIQNANKGTK
jgi:hypothetical protein